MSKREELDRVIDEAARSYNEPPAPPRDEMWAEIRRRLDDPAARPAGDAADDEAPVVDMGRWRSREARRRRVRELGPWGLGLAVAATLAIGFGLGRVTTQRIPAPAGPAVAEAEASWRLPVRLAASEHLGQAEAMLTMFRTAGAAADRSATAAWARELLTTTRLLMDSAAADDPRMAQLLGDLEVVLVQIVHAAADGGHADELDMVEQGIEQRQLITKLRAAAGDRATLSI